MEKITQKQIKELIKRILKGSYNEVLELRNRITPDGENVIFQEDYFKLDIVLDLYDLFDLLLNGGDEESIKQFIVTKIKELENDKRTIFRKTRFQWFRF